MRYTIRLRLDEHPARWWAALIYPWGSAGCVAGFGGCATEGEARRRAERWVREAGGVADGDEGSPARAAARLARYGRQVREG